jgi:hypothetical protein
MNSQTRIWCVCSTYGTRIMQNAYRHKKVRGSFKSTSDLCFYFFFFNFLCTNRCLFIFFFFFVIIFSHLIAWELNSYKTLNIFYGSAWTQEIRPSQKCSYFIIILILCKIAKVLIMKIQHKWSSQWHNFGAVFAYVIILWKKPFKMKHKLIMRSYKHFADK